MRTVSPGSPSTARLQVGWVVNHACRHRACVNVQHLRLLTVSASSLTDSASMGYVDGRKTHCKNGHLFDRTWTSKTTGKTQRVCSVCDRAKKQRLRAKWRAQLPTGLGPDITEKVEKKPKQYPAWRGPVAWVRASRALTTHSLTGGKHGSRPCGGEDRMQESKKCPRCLRNDIEDPGVLSRHDNETLICAQCGLEETQINHTPFGVDSLKEVVERERRIPLKTTGKWFDTCQHRACRWR